MTTTPHDVLPDSAEGAHFDDEYVRKGTLTAFITNARNPYPVAHRVRGGPTSVELKLADGRTHPVHLCLVRRLIPGSSTDIN